MLVAVKDYIIEVLIVPSVFHINVISYITLFFLVYKKRQKVSFWNKIIDYFCNGKRYTGYNTKLIKLARWERKITRYKRLKIRRRWFRRLNYVVLIGLAILLIFPLMAEGKYGVKLPYEVFKWW